MATNWLVAPEPDELEITLLGKGFGESVVIHTGDGEWIVIDSLLNKNRLSAPMEYLKALGVSSEQLGSIVVTHWHDDHIKGVAQLYEWAPKSEVHMPFVKNARELAAYVAAFGPTSIGSVTSGVDELTKLGFAIRQRGHVFPRQCHADSVIMRKRSVSGECNVIATALSPCPADVHAFVLQLAASAHTEEPLARRLEVFEPNAVSIAVWVEFGDDAVLLGADLEDHPDPNRGWNAVLTSKNRPPGKASYYKVAHHGSANAHHPAIWTHLLTKSPNAVLAPFNKGVGLPKSSDVKRILNLTPNAFATNATPFRKYRDGTPIVRTALEHDNIHIRAGTIEVGEVKMRKKIGQTSNWDFQLSAGACHLRNFVPRD